jgi:hypothetical protein
MRQTVISAGIAHWTVSQRHTVRITDENNSLLDWFTIALPSHHPGVGTLWQTGWHPYPGSQWVEEPPGAWTRRVFRHGINGRRQ